MSQAINIKNKKAYFEYNILEKYVAGMQLTGTEIKSVREGKVSLKDGYCYFTKGELWVKNIHIAEYALGTHYNHDPMRSRKLLLTRKELKKLEKKIKEKGLSLIALRMFISERGYAKLEIGLAQGKKLHDKRESIKAKDTKRDLDRSLKGLG